jgi:hypothetical protein
MSFIQNVGGNPLDKIADMAGALSQGKKRVKDKVQDVKDKPANLKDAAIKKVTPSGTALCNKLGHKVKKGTCPRCKNRIL